MQAFLPRLTIAASALMLAFAFVSADAQLLPNAKQTFVDSNGRPLVGGKVYFYKPNTTILKNTWRDPGLSILNTNPVILDSAGRAIIYGSGDYSQKVLDNHNNLIWNALTQTPGGGGGGGGSTSFGVVDVRSYGAVCDDITNDSVAIQNAITAVGGMGGGSVYFPVGKTCYIGSDTIIVGNGSDSQWSTYQGVSLVGASGANATIDAVGDINFPISRIRYDGSGDAIQIAGPLNGWGVSGIQIACGGNANSIGLHNISGTFGYNPNVSIYNCGIGVKDSVVSAKPPGVTVINAMHNWYSNLQIHINAATADTYYGILEDGNSLGNSCFNNFINTSIYAEAVSGATVHDMHLAATDSDVVTNLHAYGSIDGVGGVSRSVVVFDYSNGGSDAWPAGTILSAIETTAGAPTVIGTPNANSAANFWYGVKYTNTGEAPLLTNLITDFVEKDWTPNLRGATVAGTPTYTAGGQLGSVEISGFNVNVRFHIDITGIVGATGALVVSGLPVPIDSPNALLKGSCSLSNVNGLTYDAGMTWIAAWPASSSDTIVFTENGDGQAAPDFINAATQIPGAATFDGICNYRRKQIF